MASMNEFSNGLGEVSRPRERATYIAFSENAYSSWDQFVNMAPGTWMSIEVSSILLRKRLEMESKHGTGYPVRSFVTSCAAIGRNYQKHERCFVSLDSVKEHLLARQSYAINLAPATSMIPPVPLRQSFWTFALAPS